MVDIGARGRQWSRGGRLTERSELKGGGFQQHICHRIGMIGFLCLQGAPFRDIKSAGFEHAPIPRRAWRQETLDWLPLCGHQERHVEPPNIALLPRKTSAISLGLV
jgi:hypothetical protein